MHNSNMHSKNNMNTNNNNGTNNNNNNNNNNQNDNYSDYTDYRSYKKKKVSHDNSGGNSSTNNPNSYMTQSQQQRYQQNYYNNQQQQPQQQYQQQQQHQYHQQHHHHHYQQYQQQINYRNIKNNSLYNEILDQIQFSDDDLLKTVNIWVELFNNDMKKSENDLMALINQSYPFDAKTLMDSVISTFCMYRPEYISMIIETLANRIYNHQFNYRFSLPPFYAFKKLFLFDEGKEDKEQDQSNNYKNNQKYQQQPQMNYTYGIGGGLVTPIQSLYTINRVIQLQDTHFVPLQILYELTCFNLVYFLKNKDSINLKIPSPSSTAIATTNKSNEITNRKKNQDEAFLNISVWIFDCLIRSPVSIIESYFYKLLDIHNQVSQTHRKKPFITLSKYIKNSNITESELESILPTSIRKHIVSLFLSPDSLSVDSKKAQYILHSLVPILVKYQSKFISKDYHFILIHYFSNTNNSFIHRLIHNLISLSTIDNNLVINLLEFLMNNKFDNLTLQNHILPPILQGLNEDLIKEKSKIILKSIINSKLNIILFGKNYSINNNKNNNNNKQQQEENNNLIYFSETNSLKGSKILVNLLSTLKTCSSETQNLFFSLWEEYLKQTIRDSFNAVSQFWYIKQLVLHFNLFEFELKEMSKRLLLLFLNHLIYQNNQFDSKVISIFQQLTFNIFYVSSLLFNKNQDQLQSSIQNNNDSNNSNTINNSNSGDNNLIKTLDCGILVDPSVPLFLDYLQFIINKFSKNHIIYKTILKSIQQIINNITLLDSTILLKNNQFKPTISLSTTSNSNDDSQIIDTTTLEVYNIQISLEFLYSLISNSDIQSINDSTTETSDIDTNNNNNNTNLIYNNIKEFLLNIMINNNIRDNIMSLLVLNDIGFKTISLKLLLEIEKNSISQKQDDSSYWSSQEKIELLFTNLLEPNLFESCLEFLQIIKSSNYELIVASLLQKLAILSENSNENLSNAIITLLEELIIKDNQLIYQILKFVQSNLFNHYGNLINNDSNNSYYGSTDFDSNYINRNLLILLQKLQNLTPTFSNNSNYYGIINDLISQSLKNINNNNFNIQLLQYQLISNIIFNQPKYLTNLNNDHSSNLNQLKKEYHLNFYNNYIYFLIQGILSSHFSVRVLCQTIIQEFINQNPQQHKKKVLDFLIYKLKSFSINSEYNNQIPLLRKSIESIQISSLLQYNK
ncbi:hypothetical protein DICPUDRAFT_152202 [Dictyostelium purpureum]|uniref:Uncharacterized protein n=1 Tax=Dictyostelium purpureum TaxID=5786 RepID=F0ZKQ8_DICPU|nr:uncharacterized protein DICPUDRAFT_152202 [Dictyostelium purpureum]EGC35472.1 hypothetical protein DICPUDRAFT_152202 [Dictyostelium purpureum]|eukprot:XP_003288015.1 hypothetical protein DICPUDRAFT_152202 [Dictyostelium purpureum]